MPFGRLIRGILKKVHDSLLFPGRILLGIDKLTVFAEPLPSILPLCESFLDDASQQRSESRILGSRLAYTVWKVSQDRRGRFVTETGGKKEAFVTDHMSSCTQSSSHYRYEL